MIFSLLVPTLPASSTVSPETFTRGLSPVSVGSLLRAFWIWLCRSESLMALIPPEFCASGVCDVLELASPATPPVLEGAVVVGWTGVPALLWAPSPIWVAGVLGSPVLLAAVADQSARLKR